MESTFRYLPLKQKIFLIKININPNRIESLSRKFIFDNSKNYVTFERLINKNLNELLDLSGNELKELSNQIGHLISLKTLYLYDNKLITLPASIGYLKSL